jgi:hypothetical protein
VEEADGGIQASLDTIRTVRLFKSIDTHTRLDSEHAIWFSRRTRQFVSYKLREWKRATDIWSRPDFLTSKFDEQFQADARARLIISRCVRERGQDAPTAPDAIQFGWK